MSPLEQIRLHVEAIIRHLGAILFDVRGIARAVVQAVKKIAIYISRFGR